MVILMATILNYIDLDSDGDLCPDVTEAGFLDPDNDALLGTSPVIVDFQGKVTGILWIYHSKY